MQSFSDPLSSPLSAAAAHSPSQLSPNTHQPRRSTSTTSHGRSAAASPRPQIGEARRKDFSFLLRPEIYHPLTPLNVPLAFRHSPQVPDPEAPIEELVAKGHFRAAAIAAFQELTGTGAHGGVDPRDAKRVFELLYTRLACLTLIDATPLAAQEVKALEDLSSVRTYVDEATGEHLVPWELRVLNVRLQSLGFGDPRRSVMSYYDLARDAREHIHKAAAQHDSTARELWKGRLRDLGIRVAGALIDMDDLAGAAHHLGTLEHGGDGDGAGAGGGRLAFAEALMWLHVGDSEQARKCAGVCAEQQDGRGGAEEILLALCDMADANYEGALAKWDKLSEDMQDEMVSVNRAVCMLYLGRMKDVSSLHSTANSSPLLLLFYLSLYTVLKLTSIAPGTSRAGRCRGCWQLIAHTALQPVHHIRAVHREEPKPEDAARGQDSSAGAYVRGLGEA
jgi:hypothetical protein